MVYSISDLHLSMGSDKPMDVFGANWTDHHLKIAADWKEKVGPEDLVLVPGDLSWGLKLEEAIPDLKFLEELPGTKLLVKGNHDLWWGSLTKIRGLGLSGIHFLQNDSFSHEGVSYCGTRGWILPEDGPLTEEDEKIYKRELQRLELSLKTAKDDRKVVLIHYPPLGRDGQPSAFVSLMKSYGVEACVYGHLHNRFDNRQIVEGLVDGIIFRLVSCDYLDFKLIKMW